MSQAEWNELKSRRLKQTRGVSFEEIIRARWIDTLRHPVIASQKILVYEHQGYCWAVPCVVEEGKIFLKTIYPSRKLTKKYLRGRGDEKSKAEPV